MNKITIKIQEKHNGCVKAVFEINGEWKKYFTENITPFIEYQENIENIPDSILIIPFITNILPFVWLCDAEIIVNSLDKDFFENIDSIKNGYIKMYPMFNWNGKISVENIDDNSSVKSKIKSACFFSGGVDAWTTLMKHIDEKPVLLTIWGSDVKCEDKKSWDVVNSLNQKVATDFNLGYEVIKSNFRTVINEAELSRLVVVSGDGWWHGFQHGIALIGHAAPLAYLYGFANLYIASSYPETMAGQYTCASDPTIDNFVSFCGCKTVHDGREFDRLGKVRFLMNQPEERLSKMNLRVCWQADSSGKNCCRCEKCYRTILELVSVNCPGGVERFGFEWTKKDIKRCKHDFKNKITDTQFSIDSFYPPIQMEMKKNYNSINDIKYYDWLLKMDFSKFNDFPAKKLLRLGRRVKGTLGKVKHSIFR